jgi:hypothetical protein
LLNQIYQVLLALPPHTLYANAIRPQTFTLPDLITEDPNLTLDVSLRGNVAKFTSLSSGTFRFNPKEDQVGSYLIPLKVKELKSGLMSRPVNWKVEVISHSKSTEALRCPKGSNLKECVPVISSVSQDGVVEIKFPYKLKVPGTVGALERREYLRNLTASIEFELRVMQPTLGDDQGSTPEDYKEPKVFSWNVTYSDF